MSVRQNGKTIAGSNKYLPDLFDYKTTDYLLKNPSWLRADTFSWHNGDIYIPAYNQLVREANDFTDIVSETVNGITISFTLNENGHKIVNGQDSENVAKVNEIYEQTGCSWYYILDIVNKRFKLPRELTRDRDAKLIRSENNGTAWYRIYDDGWVEQGGLIPLTSTGWKDNYVITLPITMMNNQYNINFMNGYTDYIDHDTVVTARTTTNFTIRRYVSYQSEACWEVKGYSAQTYKSPKPQYLYFYVGPFTQMDIINDPDISAILDTKQDKATAVNHHYITNCITNIPQDIKLELNNGVLTLKAGSKVYIPNGFEQDGTTPHYDTQIIPNDISYSYSGSESVTGLLYYVNGRLTVGNITVTSCGPTPPSTGFIYNTATNKISFYNSDVLEWTDGSLPLADVKLTTNTVNSICHIFNGMGYIGASIFVLPGVTYLIPDGRNDDGSLKNYEYTFDKIYWITDPNNSYKLASGERMFGVKLNNGELEGQWNQTKTMLSGKDSNKPSTLAVTNTHIYYAVDTNKLYFTGTQTTTADWVEWKGITLGEYGKADDTITYLSAFYPKLVYNVSHNEHNVIDFMIPHSSNNYTWFRLYNDGWVEQGGRATVGQDSRVNVTLPIPMNSTTYQILITANSSGTIRTGGDGNYSATPTSVSAFDWMNGDDYTTTNGWWEVKGMSAYSV